MKYKILEAFTDPIVNEDGSLRLYVLEPFVLKVASGHTTRTGIIFDLLPRIILIPRPLVAGVFCQMVQADLFFVNFTTSNIYFDREKPLVDLYQVMHITWH
jgi:hypothetical protein